MLVLRILMHEKNSTRDCRYCDVKNKDQYMPPIPAPPAGAAGSGCGISATRDSVVSTIAAMEAAFWSALRVTFVGSMIPRSTISTYSPFSAS